MRRSGSMWYSTNARNSVRCSKENIWAPYYRQRHVRSPQQTSRVFRAAKWWMQHVAASSQTHHMFIKVPVIVVISCIALYCAIFVPPCKLSRHWRKFRCLYAYIKRRRKINLLKSGSSAASNAPSSCCNLAKFKPSLHNWSFLKKRWPFVRYGVHHGWARYGDGCPIMQQGRGCLLCPTQVRRTQKDGSR